MLEPEESTYDARLFHKLERYRSGDPAHDYDLFGAALAVLEDVMGEALAYRPQSQDAVKRIYDAVAQAQAAMDAVNQLNEAQAVNRAAGLDG